MEPQILNPEVIDAGPVSEAPGNKPFSIHDPDAAWLVEAGRIDLFLVQLVAGEIVSPRRHVLRLETGKVIFGCPAGQGDAESTLIAAGSPGAKLRRIDLRQLKEPDPAGEPTPASTAILEDWITALSEAVIPDQPPKVYERIESGTMATIESGRNAACVQPVVWVRHVHGASHFLGLPGTLPVMGQRYFPLTSRTWLTAATDCTLEAVGTEAFQKQDRQWQGLDYFHEVVISTLAFEQLRDHEREEVRLKSKLSSDQRQVRSAIARLARPLSERMQRFLLMHDPGGDPLVVACQTVGMAAGIDILPPSKFACLSKDPLRDIARSSNVRTRRVLLRGNWWKSNHGPLLGYWQESKAPVALIPSRRGYHLIQPASGSEQAVDAGIAQSLEPFAQTFYRPFPAGKLGAWDLLRFGVKSCGPEIWVILLTGIAGGLLGLITPIFTGILFDTVIPGAQRKELLELTALLLVGAVATGMFDLTRSLTLLRVEGRMGASLQAALWDRLLSLPVSFFRKYNAGDLADRANGIDGIRSAITGTVTNSIVSGIFSSFSLGLMFYYSWRLACVALGLVAIAFLMTLGVGMLQVREYRLLTRVSGWLSGQVMQFITGIAKFRVSATESRAFATWTKGYSRFKTHNLRSRILTNRFSVFHSFYTVFGSMCMFFAVYSWTGRISAGDFLAFMSAFGQLFTATMSLAGATLQVMTLVPIFERALPILTSTPEVDKLKADPGELTGDIEVSRVEFGYDTDGPPVLQDVSLHVQAGQFVAFVGQSGCGKSTLFRLLLGFETPASGTICYDGQDLKSLDLSAVRRQMGVVLQNSSLFRGDLFSNIIGSKPLTLDDAWEAARLCGLDEDIRQMPMGMHTIVGEGGGGLSGGQRQRLMIARAIVSRPRILLFDEATSALDNQTQAIVSRSLEGLKATRIVIAHRLSTVVHADCIFVMDHGRIVQSGPYSDLIDREGLFAQLAKRQLA